MMRDTDRISHMLSAVGKARRAIEGLSLEEYLASDDKTAALERYLMIIGEAANMVSKPLKAAHPEVPWREATDMRNFIAHEYMKVDHVLVWDAVRKDLPALEAPLRSLDNSMTHGVCRSPLEDHVCGKSDDANRMPFVRRGFDSPNLPSGGK